MKLNVNSGYIDFLDTSLRSENIKPRSCCIDLAIAHSIQQDLALIFYRKDLTFG